MVERSSININFDSLGWSLSTEPKKFRDPTFFHIADRFFELSKKYNFKYTIFIIGKDLENSEIAARVKRWSEEGHEIGNHSYSHRQNLGSLDYRELEEEVMKSHELIAKVCGKEPRGFIAPAWATSANLICILSKNGYLYDTSTFPSYFMWLVSLKLWWNFRNDSRRHDIFHRHDRLANLLANRKPHFLRGKSLIKKDKSGFLILPLPVTTLLRIPCWHTMFFWLPEGVFKWVLNSCLNEEIFYYLIHPTDLFDRRDLPTGHRNIQNIERLDVSLEEKYEMLQQVIDIIVKRSLKIVTLEQIAKEIIAKGKGGCL